MKYPYNLKTREIQFKSFFLNIGLAYAILASVPPIIGIYTAFFPAMMYIIFGTSKHASMGTFAVVSILTSKPIIEHCHNDPMMDENKIAECAVGIMSTITFLTGGLMLCLGNIILLKITLSFFTKRKTNSS